MRDNRYGRVNADTPAWPQRPPVGATCAMLATLALGSAYVWATVALSPHGALLPLYAQAALRSTLPSMRTPAPAHRFQLPDRTVLTIAPSILYENLRHGAFEEKTIGEIFKPAGVAAAITLVIFLGMGTSWDRKYLAQSRAGRLIRGPRIVTPDVYNKTVKGDGLRFDLS